jgi:large subunit ribosomal protein L35
MPKIKTKRSAAKRLKATGTGKLARNRAWKQHLNEWKPPKRKRRLRRDTLISPADIRRVRRLVPYL